MAEHLAPTELNLDYIKHVKFDHIMDTKTKGTFLQNIQLHRVVKEGKLLRQGKWLTEELDLVEFYPSAGVT
jgi:hypothetical protein